MPKAAQKTTAADTSILEKKVNAKAELQKKLGWPAESKRAVVCVPTGLTKELGGELFEEVLEGLLTLPVEILVLGKGSSSYGELMQKLVQENKHRMAIIPNTKEDTDEMLLASDIGLFLCDPSSLEELGSCLANGTVPVAPETKMLEKYNPIQESGTSFMYEKLEKWNCFAAVVRALETHIFPFDWKTIQKQCVRSVM